MAKRKGKIGEVFVEIKGDGSQLTTELRGAEAQMEQTAATMQASSTASVTALGRMASAATAVQSAVSKILIPITIISSVLGAIALLKRFADQGKETAETLDKSFLKTAQSLRKQVDTERALFEARGELERDLIRIALDRKKAQEAFADFVDPEETQRQRRLRETALLETFRDAERLAQDRDRRRRTENVAASEAEILQAQQREDEIAALEERARKERERLEKESADRIAKIQEEAFTKAIEKTITIAIERLASTTEAKINRIAIAAETMIQSVERMRRRLQ